MRMRNRPGADEPHARAAKDAEEEDVPQRTKCQVICLPYKEIAASFRISQSTVKNHLSNIYEKLEVHNIAGAIAIPQASETLIEQFKEFISTPKSAAHL